MYNRYYHVYKKIDEDLFSRIGLIKVIDEKDDSLIESWCKQKFGEKYIVKNGKLIYNWKYKMCYKTYEDVDQTIKRK